MESNETLVAPISAVDVVEHLLADVLNANQSYRQVQEKESRLINDLSLAQAQLFPLRKENARLARENHELHLDHIKQNEESRREMDRYAQKARELGDQITELRLMNKLYEQQVKEKDEIVEKLREVRATVGLMRMRYALLNHRLLFVFHVFSGL